MENNAYTPYFLDDGASTIVFAHDTNRNTVLITTYFLTAGKYADGGRDPNGRYFRKTHPIIDSRDAARAHWNALTKLGFVQRFHAIDMTVEMAYWDFKPKKNTPISPEKKEKILSEVNFMQQWIANHKADWESDRYYPSVKEFAPDW